MRGDEEIGTVIRCDLIGAKVMERKSFHSGLEGMARKRRPLLIVKATYRRHWEKHVIPHS